MTKIKPLGKWYLVKPDQAPIAVGAFMGVGPNELATIVAMPYEPGLALAVGDRVLVNTVNLKSGGGNGLFTVHEDDIRAEVVDLEEGN